MPTRPAPKISDSGPASARRALTPENERRGEGARSARLVAIFLFGCLGFAGPLLRVASQGSVPGGWPAPFVFLFGFWLLLIVLIALALRSRRED